VLAVTPSGDFNSWAPIWIIRDNDSQYSVHIRTATYGEIVGISTSNPLAANTTSLGEELYGTNGASSGGPNYWDGNQWVDGSGNSHYQTSDASPSSPMPPTAQWDARLGAFAPSATPPPPPPPFLLPPPSARLTQPTVPQGIPAIAAKTSGTPSFTGQDARNYAQLKLHPYRDLAAAPPKLQSVSFVTSGTIGSQLSLTTGLPDSALVCVITETGHFIVHGPPGSTMIGSTGYRIFDAHTGNLLIVGVK
jgi:hypothetical protein